MRSLFKRQNARIALVVLSFLCLLFLANSRRPFRLGMAREAPERTSADLARLAEKVSLWLPGGVQVTDPQRIAEILTQDSGRAKMQAAVAAESLGVDQYAAQVADGTDAGADIRIESSFVLMNTGNRESKVVIEFYTDSGSPWEVTIGGVKASQFEYTLAAGRTVRARTEAQGPIGVGWARLHMTQPVGVAFG